MFFVFSHWILQALLGPRLPCTTPWLHRCRVAISKSTNDVKEAFASAAEEAERTSRLIVEPHSGGVVLKNGHFGEPRRVDFDVSIA